MVESFPAFAASGAVSPSPSRRFDHLLPEGNSTARPGRRGTAGWVGPPAARPLASLRAQHRHTAQRPTRTPRHAVSVLGAPAPRRPPRARRLRRLRILRLLPGPAARYGNRGGSRFLVLVFTPVRAAPPGRSSQGFAQDRAPLVRGYTGGLPPSAAAHSRSPGHQAPGKGHRATGTRPARSRAGAADRAPRDCRWTGGPTSGPSVSCCTRC